MAGFTPRPGLDATIAARYAYPAVDRALDSIQRHAQVKAPGVGVWLTAMDDRVRPSHRDAHGQEVPDNLRFRLPKATGMPGVDLARAPRDPDLPAANREECRCQVGTLPDALKRSIHRTPALLAGTRVSGECYTEFPRAAESEFGTDGDEAAHFMGDALRETAREIRGMRIR